TLLHYTRVFFSIIFLFSSFFFFPFFFFFSFFLFFFTDTATTEIYTLSLHDALPISCSFSNSPSNPLAYSSGSWRSRRSTSRTRRSEEHTSELQSLAYLVCRLLLEKKKKKKKKKHKKKTNKIK